VQGKKMWQLLSYLLICLLATLASAEGPPENGTSIRTELVYLQTGRGERCFYEFLSPGEGVTGSFEVISAAPPRVDFTTRFGDNTVISRSTKTADNYFVDAKMAGQYAFCISVIPSIPPDAPPEQQTFSVSFKLEIHKTSAYDPRDPFTRTLDTIGNMQSSIQAGQRNAKQRERKMGAAVSSLNKKAWLSLVIEALCVFTAYGFQTAFLTQLHKRA